AARGRAMLAGRLHAPNQSSQMSTAIIRPAATQTSSCSGRISASPVATRATRVAMAARIPMPATNIQAGKNAPNRTKEGAPRCAQALVPTTPFSSSSTPAHPLICRIVSPPTALRLISVVGGRLLDLCECHSARDVTHLLAYVVVAVAGSEG